MKMLSIILVMNMLLINLGVLNGQAEGVNPTSQVITSMAAVGATTIQVGMDGGVGFQFPNFNNGASFEEVKNDIALFVKEGSNDWVPIDNNAESGWIYDVNFGNWWEGPGGYWFNPVDETTKVKVASKTNTNIFVEYTLNVTPANPQVITSMAPAGATLLDVSPSGGVGFEFPRFNNGATFKDVKDDIALFVKQNDEWVSIDNNAASGWIYDNNFGNWWEGPGGYWFNPVEETTVFKVASKTNPDVFVEYTLKVTVPVRNSHTISNYDGRSTFEADENGAIGLPLPKIDGGAAIKREVDNFVYEVKVDGEWVNILETDFRYSTNGYNRMSSANQWGYWTDYIFGLWFQPIQEDVDLRIGYPLNGEKGGDIGANYVQYKFIGNPDAFRPDEVALDDIQIGTSTDSEIAGWELVFNDEFEGTELDTSKWNYETGYYLNDDPGTWGWGNNELQHYTDSENNVFVEDGNLNIKALDDPATFPQDPERVAPYSSGKITTQDKFTFKYGRIDFSAKLPAVSGAWPALWMMPNDNVYGGWASSGEIDVMEARGRVPESTSGAIHFGGEWPSNQYLSGEQTFEGGGRIDTDFHVYSVIWEEDTISWYVDGKFFYKVTKEQWFSAAVRDNPLAPFDQDFYIIMNLALGGWFDGGREPSIEDFPITMQVDYVRVYKEEEREEEEPVNVPVTSVKMNKSEVTLTAEGQKTTLLATVAPSNATNKKLTWSSSDPSVATVSGTGVVTALKNGTTTITVTTEDGNMVDTSTVVVDIIPQLTQDQIFPLKNGSFSQQLTNWSAWSWNKNDSFIDEVQVVDGKAKINVPKFDASGTGAEKWAVQFRQTDLKLLENKEYLISFDASSTVARDMELVVQNSAYNRVLEKTISLTSESKRYTYSFKATAEELVELNFLLGKYADYDQHEVTIDNVVLEVKNAPTNKIKNHTFKEGTSSWEVWSDVGATSKINEEKHEITIPSLGNEFWSIQFSQLGLPLENSKSYRLVFDMSSTIDRKIDAILESASYDKYLWETVEINEESNTYAIEFTHDKNTDLAAKLVLALGKVEGQEAIGEHVVTIDNVYLYEISALPAEDPEDPEVPDREGYGVGTIKENSVEFYVADVPWAIISYIKNGTTQQNIMMHKNGEDVTYTLTGVKEGDEIRYWFTYGLEAGGQAEYPEQVYTHKFETAPEPEPEQEPRPEAPIVNTISNLTKKVTGTAETGAVVTVQIGEKKYTETANKKGEFKVKIPVQKEGTSITITATDADGKISEAVTVEVVDEIAPSTPKVDKIYSNTTSVTGKAEAFTTITITVGKEVIGTSKTDKNGNFEVTISKQKKSTELSVTATDAANNTSKAKRVKVKK
jgi:beta-glucanase (GH16 family)